MKKAYITTLVAVACSVSVVGAQIVDVNVQTQVSGINVNAKVSATSTIKNNNATSTKKATTTVKATGQNRATTTTNTSSSMVSIKARAIRGWDEGEKAEFLTTVKAHAELRSGQDLENFAKGVLLKDEDVAEIKTGSSTVEVTYKLPAKFLGVFGASLKATTDVTFDDKNKTPKEVTVKFPWYRMFYSLDADARADVIEAAIEASLGEDPGINTGTELSKKGRTIQLISNLLKEVRLRVEGEVE